MTKISYLRKNMQAEYESGNILASLEAGEALISEHRHIETAGTINFANDLFNLALVYDEAEKYDDAAAMYSESAREIFVLEGETVDFAKRLSGFASSLSKMDMHEPAYFLHYQVCKIYEEKAGKESTLYSDSVFNFANAAVGIGHLKEAINNHMFALSLRTIAAQHKDNDAVIESFLVVAKLHEKNDDLEKAVSFTKAALELSDEKSEVYVSANYYLAEIYEADEEFEKSLDTLQKVLDLTYDQVGTNHSSYINTLIKMALVKEKDEEYEDALYDMEEARKLFEDTVGKEQTFYAFCCKKIAWLHSLLGNKEDARAEMLESIAIRKELGDIPMDDYLYDIQIFVNLNSRDDITASIIVALINALKFKVDLDEVKEQIMDIFGDIDDDELVDNVYNDFLIFDDPESLDMFVSHILKES